MEPSKKLFANLESETFRQEAQIMNNLATFTRSIIVNKSVSDYLEENALYPKEGASILIERMEKLLALKNDSRFLHKYDASIAAYLYVLNKLNRTSSQGFMASLSVPSNTWWSQQMVSVLSKKEDTKKTVYSQELVSTKHSPGEVGSVSFEVNDSATANIKGVFV